MPEGKAGGVDPFTLALVQNRLDHIARQMGWVMIRTSLSPIFSQSHDFSCFLTNRDGVLVSQADGLPIHTGGGGFTVRALLDRFAGRIAPDDVFLSSDPYVAGGNHQPDWVISRPVFAGGELVGFACNRAHQSDIGGGAAGTYNAEATEIFHEGIRLPPLRVIEQGELRDDVWELLLLNSRTPHLLDGDLRAMLGSTRIGAERVTALFEELGPATALGYMDEMLDYAERRFAQALTSLPDGTYEAEETSDNDCFTRRDVTLRVKVTVKQGRLTVDFTGSEDQIRGFKNSSVANTHSAVYTAVASFLEPDLPHNEGAFRTIEVIAPEGSIVNPRPPAPMTMNTVFIGHDIVHVVWKALSRADPDRACAGWAKAVHGLSSGLNRDGRPFVLYHWNVLPAGGAVAGRDGLNQVGMLPSLGGLTSANAETNEMLYPVRIDRQEFRTDTAGPGAFRGGTGIHYEAELLVEAEHSFRGEGLHTPSGYGVRGGGWGDHGFMQFTLPDGEVYEPPQYGVRRLPPVRMDVKSPGGGGWGDPLAREPARVLRDVRDGVVSPAAARAQYGVVIVDGVLDPAATEAERSARRN
jgi:N-methylhydantoinase B